MALLVAISLWGSVWAEDVPSVAAAASCVWCHPQTEEDQGASIPFGLENAGPSTSVAVPSPGRTEEADTAEFAHELHLPVGCESCHVGLDRPDPRNYTWCDGCHHRPQSTDACARCHDTGAHPDRRFDLVFRLPGGPEERQRTFPHDAHTEVRECAECHGDPPGALDEEFTCFSCHMDHHETETVACLGCHEPPPTWAHEDVVVHQTCSGGVCHKAFDPGPPDAWPRSACEACHTDFTGVETLPDVPEHMRPDTSLVPLSGISLQGGPYSTPPGLG